MAPDLVEIRRDLHRHPELSFEEVRTAAIASTAMEALGCRVRTQVGITGVVADLENGEGPTIALRADMDALPIHETNTHAFVSETPGVMHACGHDAHVAGLIGAAKLLAHEREEGRLPPAPFGSSSSPPKREPTTKARVAQCAWWKRARWRESRP